MTQMLNPLSKWLRMLTGKPVVTQQSSDKPAPAQVSGKKEAAGGEVEIKPEDIRKEGVFAQGVRGIKETVGKITPAGTKGAEAVKKGLPKPLLGALAAVILLLIISLLASKFAPALRRGGKETGGEVIPTPSPVGYIKYKPSVYAGDPKILQLEEEINILDREIASTILKDDTLKPPMVDFNINFKQ